MLIGGFQKFSLIDYPDKICAIVFTQGCNFRCGYCYNPELVEPKLFSPPIPEKEIFSFLENRKEKLDAVEITGGEPTLQPDLLEFIRKIKDMGFLVKLDSNGTHPDVIEKAIKDKLVDYIAMDIKAPLEKYAFVTQVNINVENIKKSIDIIMHSNLDYQFRTTVVKSLLSIDDLKQICKLIKGARCYILQKFRKRAKIVDSSLLNRAEYSEDEMQKFQDIVTALIQGE